MQQRWPESLWIVRHGESSGNVARFTLRVSLELTSLRGM